MKQFFYALSLRGMWRSCGVVAVSLWASAAWAQSAANVSQSSSVLEQHYNLAQSSQSAGRFDEAARQYRLFIADALAEMALQAVRVQDYSRAAPLFDESLMLAPNSPGLKVRYAQAALAAHDLSRARTLTEGILRDYPDNPKAAARAHLVLGRVMQQMNLELKAREQFEAAVALDPSFDNGYALAVACLDLGDEPAATRVFAEMIAGLGDTPALRIQMGRAYLNSDFQPTAIPEFEKAVAEDPSLPGPHYALATAYMVIGGDDALPSAKAALDVEVKLSPDDAGTHALLGNIARMQHDLPTAEQELRRAIALGPADPAAQLYLGELDTEMGNDEGAIAAFQRAIELTKDPAQNRYQIQKAHYLLGRLLVKAGKEDAAKKELQIAAVLLKKSLGKDRDRMAGQFDEKPEGGDPVAAIATAGESDLEKLLTPALADSYNNLGVIAATNGAYSQALAAFERAYEWNPKLSEINANWGRAAVQSGQFQEAIGPLTRALQEEPSNVAVRSGLALSLFHTAQYAATLHTLEPLGATVDTTPELAYARDVSRGAIALEQNNTDEAIRELEQAERLNAANPELHKQLAIAYRKLHRGPDADREQALSESLAQAASHNANAVSR
jgi:tetratricopeptide (TPR) repeat protein